jgi:hypothetical protein
MRSQKFISVWMIALVAALLGATAASASPPSTYKGSIEGSVETSDTAVDTGLVYKGRDTFKVSGLKFKRVRVGKSVDKRSAGYKITAGKVTWTSTMTGGCQYSYTDSFSLKSVIGSGEPLQFDNFSGPWKMFAEINATKSVTIKQLCTVNDGTTGESEVTVDLPRLLSSGGNSVKQKPGASITRTFRDKYSSGNSSSSSTWKLKLRS